MVHLMSYDICHSFVACKYGCKWLLVFMYLPEAGSSKTCIEILSAFTFDQRFDELDRFLVCFFLKAFNAKFNVFLLVCFS